MRFESLDARGPQTTYSQYGEPCADGGKQEAAGGLRNPCAQKKSNARAGSHKYDAKDQRGKWSAHSRLNERNFQFARDTELREKRSHGASRLCGTLHEGVFSPGMSLLKLRQKAPNLFAFPRAQHNYAQSNRKHDDRQQKEKRQSNNQHCVRLFAFILRLNLPSGLENRHRHAILLATIRS